MRSPARLVLLLDVGSFWFCASEFHFGNDEPAAGSVFGGDGIKFRADSLSCRPLILSKCTRSQGINRGLFMRTIFFALNLAAPLARAGCVCFDLKHRVCKKTYFEA